MSLLNVRSLGACLILALLCPCAKPRSTGALSLVDRFAQGRLGPVLAHNEGGPDYRIVPFLGPGWTFLPGKHLEARDPAEFQYYLLHPVEVQVALESRGKGLAAIGLNGSPLGTVKLSREWAAHTFKVPAGKVGLNRISIAQAPGSQWKACRVEPVHQASSLPPAKASEDTLFLPFGQTLDFGIPAPQGGRLVIDDVRPWLAPGAPQPDGWSLEITAGEDEHKVIQGGERRIRVPRANLQTLTLACVMTHPLPGQIGLQVVSPRITGLAPQVQPSPTVAPSKRPRRPNVLIFLVDTLRADHLGCYGYTRPTSKEIDTFSQDAVLFENATAQSSWTLPSVASIFTSKLPNQHGVTDFPDILAQDNLCLAEALSEQGYKTGAFIANALLRPESGFDQGFSRYQLSQGARSQQIVSAGISWLKRVHDQPFFLYLHVLQPHAPHEPPREFRTKFAPDAGQVDYNGLTLASRAVFWEPTSPKPDPRMTQDFFDLYDAEVAAVSSAFGKLITELKRYDLYEDTLIIFVSDHGEELLDHGSFGHIHSLYQEVVDIPLIVKFPDSRYAGTRTPRVVQHIDIGPTVLQEVGLEQREGSGLPLDPATGSLDARPVLFSANAGWGDEGYREWLYSGMGVRSGRWVLLKTEASALNRFAPLELYNLENDPEQKHNLVFERPDIALYLEGFLIPSQLARTAKNPKDIAPVNLDILRGLQYIR